MKGDQLGRVEEIKISPYDQILYFQTSSSERDINFSGMTKYTPII